ncbi:MAG: response regulator [Ferruginibacter sp.]
MTKTNTTNSQTKKILIIEDEGDICLLLNLILKEDDIDLDHVNTLSKAKEYLLTEQPSLVILDNCLPDGLGLDFIDFLRTEYPSLKILMISGFHATEAKEVALHNGADIFLEKPFTKEQVFHAVHQLLSQEENEILSN